MTEQDADSVWLDKAEAEALTAVRAHAQNGCCANNEWRGRYCQYHLGMVDGVEVLLIHLRQNDGSETS